MEMGKWNHKVSIGVDDILENESTSVEKKGQAITERLSCEACFRSFPHFTELRAARDAEELDEWLTRMYDYADRNRFWIT